MLGIRVPSRLKASIIMRVQESVMGCLIQRNLGRIQAALERHKDSNDDVRG